MERAVIKTNDDSPKRATLQDSSHGFGKACMLYDYRLCRRGTLSTRSIEPIPGSTKLPATVDKLVDQKSGE